MRKFTFYCILTALLGLTISSCRKDIIPKQVIDHPDPPPPPPEPEIIETQPAVLTPNTVTINSVIKGFYSAVPSHYHETNKRYPLIIFFHGGGQYGDGSTQLYTVLRECLPKALNDKTFPPSFTVNDETFSFIVLMPQFTKLANYNQVNDFVQYAKANYRIDTTRIYLMGFSLGGRMLTDYAARFPNEVAAVVPMGGVATDDRDFSLVSKCENIARSNLPVWLFHNLTDQAWNVNGAKTFVADIQSFQPAIPPRATYFEKPEGRLNHDCWNRAADPSYKESDSLNVYQWMLQYSR